MKVYVITKGSYSDYGICAVAIDREKAEMLKIACSDRWEEARVEEYDTEEFKPIFEGKLPYMVYFDESGSVDLVELSSPECFECGINSGTKWDKVRKTWCKTILVSLYAKNEEQAIKVAAEKRAEYLAEEFGL